MAHKITPSPAQVMTDRSGGLIGGGTIPKGSIEAPDADEVPYSGHEGTDVAGALDARPPRHLSASSAPTASDDQTQGHVVGCRWIKLDTGTIYTAVDVSTGAAVWTSGGGGSGIDVEGDSGSVSGATELEIVGGTDISIAVTNPSGSIARATVTYTGSGGGGGGGWPETSGTGLDFESSTIGGTALGTPTTIDSDTTVPGALYIEKAANAGFSMHGRYWSLASDLGINTANPFTVEADLFDAVFLGNFSRHGIILIESSSGSPARTFGIYREVVSGELATISSTTPTSGAAYVTNSSAFAGWGGPLELRIVFTSSSSVTFFARVPGAVFWVPVGGTYNPGWTPTWVALSSNPENAGFGVRSAWRHLWATN